MIEKNVAAMFNTRLSFKNMEVEIGNNLKLILSHCFQICILYIVFHKRFKL